MNIVKIYGYLSRMKINLVYWFYSYVSHMKQSNIILYSIIYKMVINKHHAYNNMFDSDT